jgi:predicted DNA-binding protein with PD1-like motif
MHVLQNNPPVFLLRLDKGDELFSVLKTFCLQHTIKAGWFQGLGAAGEVILSFYDLDEKKYIDVTLQEDVEIVSLTGNVGWLQNEYAFHAHGVFATKDYSTKGGHVKKLVVSATCELFLTTLTKKLVRKYDEQTGLQLLTSASPE